MNLKLSEKINLLGFIAIIGVVFIHASTAMPRFQKPDSVILGDINVSSFIQFFVGNGLARFCIPLFFIISGYLFFYAVKNYSFRNYSYKLLKRLKTLVLPFIFWSFFGYFCSRRLLNVPFFAEAVPFPNYDFSLTKVVRFCQVMIYTGISTQLWFVVQLFIMVVFSYPLYWILRTWLFLPLMVLLTFLFFYKVWLGPVSPPFLTFPIYISSEAMLFFSLGSILAIHEIDIAPTVSRPKALLCLSLWAFLLVVKTLLSYRYSLPNFHNILVLFGLPCIWFSYDHLIANNIKLKSFLLLGAEHTFLIFVAHLPFLTILATAIQNKLGFSPSLSLTMFLTLPPFFIISLVFIGRGLKNIAPRTFSLVTGGRV